MVVVVVVVVNNPLDTDRYGNSLEGLVQWIS